MFILTSVQPGPKRIGMLLKNSAQCTDRQDKTADRIGRVWPQRQYGSIWFLWPALSQHWCRAGWRCAATVDSPAAASLETDQPLHGRGQPRTGGTPEKDSQHERVLEPMRALGTFTQRTFEISVPARTPVRYVRVTPGPQRVAEIRAYEGDRMLNRDEWRASNLFGPYDTTPAVRAWQATIRMDEAAANSYLAIPIYGEHGVEGAYAALRVNGQLRAAG